jgi:uncharacterized protein (DUF305 family)
VVLREKATQTELERGSKPAAKDLAQAAIEPEEAKITMMKQFWQHWHLTWPADIRDLG